MSYLDEHQSEVKNAGYYRRQMKLLEEKLAAKDAEIAELNKEIDALKSSEVTQAMYSYATQWNECLREKGQERFFRQKADEKLAAAHQEIAALKGDAEPVAWYYPEDVKDNTRVFKVATTNNLDGTMVPLYLHPSKDKLDAERYRWLHCKTKSFDAAVDAAMGTDE